MSAQEFVMLSYKRCLKSIKYFRDLATISDKIVDTFTFLTPYFVAVILFALLACPFRPPSPQIMLCRNCCDLGEQTSNIEWGSGVFTTVFFAIKRVVLVGVLIVLWKDIVSINYVADCSKFATYAISAS